MNGLPIWAEVAHPDRQAISTAALRRKLEPGVKLHLVFGRRVRESDDLPDKVLTVRLVETHEFACSDSTRDDDRLVYLPFARGGQHANQVTWYATPDGVELEGPHALLRYRLEPPETLTSLLNPEGAIMNNKPVDLNAVLENASPEALAHLLDASYDTDACTVVLESTEVEALDDELEQVLADCGAKFDADQNLWCFAEADTVQAFMTLVQSLAPEEAPAPEATANDGAGESEFIVFNAEPLAQPESLPDEAREALELETKGYTLRRVPLQEIRVEPANNPRTRTDTAGVIRLARSIAKRGLLQPVTVRPIEASSGEPGSEAPCPCAGFELVFGYRRIAAIRLAITMKLLNTGWAVPCVVRKLNDSQVRLAALTENEEREEVDLLDQAEGWARLRLTQTESGIADAAGVPLVAVRRCLKVAFGVCDEVKAAYREGKLNWQALIAFSYGSLEQQRMYLAGVGTATWKLNAEHVRQAMRSTEFKLANARFTLEEYEAAGGAVEADLWQSNEGTRLPSSEIVQRLQAQWAEAQVEVLKARGAAFVELRFGEWNWWTEFNRVGLHAVSSNSQVGAVVHVRADWAVDVLEGLTPNAGHVSNAGQTDANPSYLADSNTPGLMGSGNAAKPEKQKLEYSEAGITLARRLRTAALQQAILENADAKLPLALSVMGYLGEREARFSVKSLGEADALASSTILAELEVFAARVPRLSFNPHHGLELNPSCRFDPNARLEVLAALLALPRTQLDRLHRLLVATMIGDWVSVTDAGQNRHRTLKLDPFIAGLAAHLGVRGGEAFELHEAYLKTIGFRKAKLEPYLTATVGEGVARALMDNPRPKIIAEILAQKSKLASDFVPPELEFAKHAPQGLVSLGAFEEDDDFASDHTDADTLEAETDAADLIGEDELEHIRKLPIAKDQAVAEQAAD